MSGGGEVLLAARGAALGYGRTPVLRGVDLEVRAGDFWFLLGPNGAGKTTILRAFTRAIRPLAGEVFFHPERASPARMGFVPQRCELNPRLPTTVGEFTTLGLAGLRLPRAEERERLAWALDRAALGGLERRSYWTLSGGQRQRALIARALIRRPEILLVDEPATGLDPAAEAALMRALAELNAAGLTVLFVSHDLPVAVRYGTHLALMRGGEARAGARDEVLTPENLRSVYGVEFTAGRDASGAVVLSERLP